MNQEAFVVSNPIRVGIFMMKLVPFSQTHLMKRFGWGDGHRIRGTGSGRLTFFVNTFHPPPPDFAHVVLDAFIQRKIVWGVLGEGCQCPTYPVGRKRRLTGHQSPKKGLGHSEHRGIVGRKRKVENV